MLALLRLGGGLALVSESYLDVPNQPNALLLTDKFGWLITLAVTVGAVVDIIIAGSLCYYLKRLSAPLPYNR